MTIADIPAVMPMEHELFADQAWSSEMLADEIADTQSRMYLVACDGECIVGYAGLAAYDIEAHILTVGTDSQYQRQGIGRALLRALLAEADRRKIERVILEVRVDNEPAISLYESESFAAVSIRKKYYQPGGQDAVVMIRGATYAI
ncbi:MAG: ribosomal protein S18-alanine N-acetyltransferase [Antricoccus sp.]